MPFGIILYGCAVNVVSGTQVDAMVAAKFQADAGGRQMVARMPVVRFYYFYKPFTRHMGTRRVCYDLIRRLTKLNVTEVWQRH